MEEGSDALACSTGLRARLTTRGLTEATSNGALSIHRVTLNGSFLTDCG